MPHPVHGFIELSALPAFDEATRGDPDATRRHRRAMTQAEHAFLSVEVDGAAPQFIADPSDPFRPRWRCDAIEVVAEAAPDAVIVRQSWSVREGADIVLHLRGSIDRPALAEITEVNPPTPIASETVLRIGADAVELDAASLPARVTLSVDGAPVAWVTTEDGLRGTIANGPGLPATFTLAVGFGTDASDGNRSEAANGDALTERALAYVRGCTALRTADDERTILTDHRILPLSWTRDGYWQALALLIADGPGDRERVADHLRWLWRRCERPDGRWMRSHHANGLRKDLAFQADQQLYPIIELADYWRASGDLPGSVDWSRQVAAALDAALEECDATTGLIASAENAADDPIEAPFIAASQILLWYAAGRLIEIATAGAVDLDTSRLRETAAAIHAAFGLWIADGERAWPYAVDGHGARVAYHDANDLPVALAATWGFCGPDDRGWRATMGFAFSEANPAYFIGDRSGLGSAHTPGPWALGDVQAWIVARTIGDEVSAADALARLRAVAFGDAMLPEAYSVGLDPDLRVRHWFAWPGAALAALRLLDAAGDLPGRLTVRIA
jgi:uncharacterized protein